MSRRRGWIVSALTACAVAGVVLGAGWTLQAAVLPEPTPQALVATQAMSWLAGDRTLASTYVLGGGEPVHSTCATRKLRFPDGNVEAAVLLETDGQKTLIPVGYPFRTVQGTPARRPSGLALTRLQLAGCPPVLESTIGGLITRKTEAPVGRARVAGRPALTLQIWTKAGRLTVFLAEDSKQPLAITLAGPRLSGRASLSVPPALPATADASRSGV